MIDHYAMDQKWATGGAVKPLNLDQIQGNIVGFQKDYQTFLFLRFPDDRPEKAHKWLQSLIPQVSTATEVLAFKALFKVIRRRKGREGTIKATWLNVAFTHAGLQALRTPLPKVPFTDAYVAGMSKRAREIGDEGRNAPHLWVFPADGGEIHAVILLAADSQVDLDAEAGRQIVALTAAGIQLLFKQDGRDRPDEPGHEHFGFKDGVSQPGILDKQLKDDESQIGQESVCPGEFVLGYPRQSKEGEVKDAGGDEESPCVAAPVHTFLENGSYLVFRRLRQNVRGFREFVRDTAAAYGITEDLLGAKLVGRYRSGAPLAALDGDPEGANRFPEEGEHWEGLLGQTIDPGLRCPNVLGTGNINNFKV